MPAFDTHKAVKELCSAGFDDAQAEAVVDQIHGAVNENVATKADIEKLPTREELRDAIANLATKGELRDATTNLATREALRHQIANLATREELRDAIANLATKEELRDAVANLASKEELKQEVEKLELRLATELEKLTTKCLRYVGVAAAAVVGLTKALDLLVV